MSIHTQNKHVELFDKLALANGYLEWIATLNDAINLAAKHNAHPDTIKDLIGISNFLIDGCIHSIDVKAESIELSKIRGDAL